jgi:hypothetical protein
MKTRLGKRPFTYDMLRGACSIYRYKQNFRSYVFKN